jgi:hypothetical protein
MSRLAAACLALGEFDFYAEVPEKTDGIGACFREELVGQARCEDRYAHASAPLARCGWIAVQNLEDCLVSCFQGQLEARVLEQIE